MSKGGGTSTQTQSSSLDPDVKERMLENYDFALDVANREYQPYPYQRIAGFTPLQEASFQRVGEVAGSAQQPITQAQALARQAGAYTPGTIASGMAAYQNPYTQQVIDTTLADIDRSRQMANQQTAAQAVRARAFGGSRQGVAEAETNRAAMEQAARTAAQLRAQGFQQAGEMAGRDIGYGLQGNQQALAAAQQLGALGALGQTAGLTGAQAMFQSGEQQRGLTQANMSQAYEDFLRQFQYPVEQLRIRQSALGMAPMGQTTTTESTPSFLQQVGTIGQAAGGLANAFNLLFR